MIRRLKIWEKLVLICVTFSIPTVVLTYYFVKTSSKDNNFARKEICGNEYNQQVRNVLDRLQQRRQMMVMSPTGGAASGPHLSQLDNQIDSFFGTLEGLQQKTCLSGTYANELDTTQMLSHLRSQWQELKNLSAR